MPRENVVGLIRPVRRYTEKQQRAMLADECGRIWSYDELDRLLKYLRPNDVVVVPLAHCLGPTRRDVHATMQAIFAKGAGIMSLEPETLTAKQGAEAAAIAMQAVAGLTGDSRVLTAEEGKKFGKRSWKKKQSKRTSIEVARKFWHSERAKQMTAEQRIHEPEMRGWSITTAYRHLGPPMVKAGPKPKK